MIGQSDQCRHCCELYVAPATQGSVRLHYTIPDLLDMGCAYGHAPALHQWSSQGWQTYTYAELRTAAEEFALGLLAQPIQCSTGSLRSRCVGLLLDNNIDWVLADMGSLLAGWVTVPIDFGQSVDTVRWMLSDANVRILVVNWHTLKRIYGHLQPVELLIIVDQAPPPAWFDAEAIDCLTVTLRSLLAQGRRHYSSNRGQGLKQAIQPDDVATIVYTADATGIPKGVLLSHRSLTGNIWAAFSSMPGLLPGGLEVALSFLPLNHIFARTFLYGHLGFGHDVYFSSPQWVFRHLAMVKPTIFITVPRLLEKLYERIHGVQRQSSGLKRVWLTWGWYLAHRSQPIHDLWGYWPGSRFQRWFLGHGVFLNLHQALGGNIRYLLSGGAALRPEVMTFFNGVGIPVKQGYGLTETSSVLSYTRSPWLRSGTVGAPIPGVEMRLATDGEVLVKSPYTMAGYHRNPAATDAVIDADGWLHTGDLGEFSDDGVLTLQGCKKGLFKLSTGKYVAPGPIEAELERSPLVKRALLVGPGQKFCGALMVPARSEGHGLGVHGNYQALIDRVNGHLPHWSTIKRFVLVELKGGASSSRMQRYQAYAQEIQDLYRETERGAAAVPRRFWGWRYLQALYPRDWFAL